MEMSRLRVVFMCVSLAMPAPGPVVIASPRPAKVSSSEAMSCAAVADLRFPDMRITEAVAQSSGPERVVTVPTCRVTGVVGREIQFRLLLPDTWNGRFLMGGGGGFVGGIDNQALASVNSGYATVGTDTGHKGLPFSGAWALNDLERLVNFGHVAVHRVAEVAKAIIAAYYASPPARSYFVGCSNGGRQAMMEAQRYPGDFNGIVSGAPALDFVGIGAQFIRDTRVLYPDRQRLADPLFTADHLKLIETRMLAACDLDDGVKDGIVDDPRRCRFDPVSIPACPAETPETECLTRRQQRALAELYAPTTNGEGEIYPAQPVGGESEAEGWGPWITGVNEQVYKLSSMPSLRFAFGTEMFKYFIFHDPAWDYTKYDLSTWKKDTKLAATFLNATDPNLDAFKARRGKLVMWHGWSDPALTALGTTRYYEQVERRDPNVRDYFRLFMAPGVLHCGGGPGPDRVDWPAVISEWVEKGAAPESVVASKLVEGKPTRTRPLCPYPQRAVYRGSGSTDEAASFECRAP